MFDIIQYTPVKNVIKRATQMKWDFAGHKAKRDDNRWVVLI